MSAASTGVTAYSNGSTTFGAIVPTTMPRLIAPRKTVIWCVSGQSRIVAAFPTALRLSSMNRVQSASVGSPASIQSALPS